MPALFRHDLVLRAAGVALLLSAIACLARVFHHPAAGWLEEVEAGYGFIGCSGGAILVLLGRHIHDPVAVSGRWATMTKDRHRP